MDLSPGRRTLPPTLCAGRTVTSDFRFIVKSIYKEGGGLRPSADCPATPGLASATNALGERHASSASVDRLSIPGRRIGRGGHGLRKSPSPLRVYDPYYTD